MCLTFRHCKSCPLQSSPQGPHNGDTPNSHNISSPFVLGCIHSYPWLHAVCPPVTYWNCSINSCWPSALRNTQWLPIALQQDTKLTLASASFSTRAPLTPFAGFSGFSNLFNYQAPASWCLWSLVSSFSSSFQKSHAFPYSEKAHAPVPPQLILVLLPIFHFLVWWSPMLGNHFYHWSVSPGIFYFWDRRCSVLSIHFLWGNGWMWYPCHLESEWLWSWT